MGQTEMSHLKAILKRVATGPLNSKEILDEEEGSHREAAVEPRDTASPGAGESHGRSWRGHLGVVYLSPLLWSPHRPLLSLSPPYASGEGLRSRRRLLSSQQAPGRHCLPHIADSYVPDRISLASKIAIDLSGLDESPSRPWYNSANEGTEQRPMKQSRGAKTEMQRAKDLTAKQREELLRTLKARFDKNMNRHKGLEWAKVQTKLESNNEKLWSLYEMERTGGEPDVVGHDKQTGEYIFYDCSAESPKGRRSVCYDREGLESRKEHKPENNAIDMAAAMGIELLKEEHYRELQQLGAFDMKTSSWVKTPSDIRELGGALFGDFRYGKVFVYHNGAQSYYGARGFRGSLRV
jgi:Protein of unknown function (DUF4256)